MSKVGNSYRYPYMVTEGSKCFHLFNGHFASLCNSAGTEHRFGRAMYQLVKEMPDDIPCCRSCWRQADYRRDLRGFPSHLIPPKPIRPGDRDWKEAAVRLAKHMRRGL